MQNKLTVRQIVLIAILTTIITISVMIVFSFVLAQFDLSENIQQTLRGAMLLFTIFLTLQILYARFRKSAAKNTNSDSM